MQGSGDRCQILSGRWGSLVEDLVKLNRGHKTLYSQDRDETSKSALIPTSGGLPRILLWFWKKKKEKRKEEKGEGEWRGEGRREKRRD